TQNLDFYTVKNINTDPFIIVSIDPEQGTVGDLITINGLGFGTNPGALNLYVANDDDTATPLEIINVTDNQIQVKLPPAILSSSGYVTLEKGTSSQTTPLIAGIDFLSPIEIFSAKLPLSSAQGSYFTTTDQQPPPGASYHFSESLWGSEFVTFRLNSTLPLNATYSLSMSARDKSTGIGFELKIDQFRFTDGLSTPLERLQLLCQFIEDTVQLETGIDVDCTVTSPGFPDYITMTFPGGTLNRGHMALTELIDPIIAFGNEHQPIKTSGLTLLSDPERVQVNINGYLDGVSVTIPNSQTTRSFLAEFNPYVALDTYGASRIDILAHGTVDGAPDQLFGHAYLRNVLHPVKVFGSFTDLGADRVRVQVLNNGTPTGEFTTNPMLIGNGGLAVFQQATLNDRPDLVNTSVNLTGGNYYISFKMDRVTDIDIVNDSTYSGDEVRLYPADSTGNPDNYGKIDNISRIDLLGVSLNFTISNETVEKFSCGDIDHPYPPGDLDQNCRVDFFDYIILANDWPNIYNMVDLWDMSNYWLFCNNPDGCFN
ncbi:MAG: hypothetical protein GY869_06610, partial [Planctomycetes bacterium]|nr:hypothetical protein [Planctomycetota bacterium]